MEVVIIISYFVVGAVAGVCVRVMGGGGRLRPALMLVLWPFLLPAAMARSAPAALSTPGDGGRLDRVSAALDGALAAAVEEDGRGRRVVETYVARLRAQSSTLAELDAAIVSASPSVRPKLQQLEASSRARIDQGIDLLEEMVAQLTLLRFSGLATGSDDERQRIEDLMNEIEAMAELGR